MNRNDKVIDEDYLKYIRSLPCLVSACRNPRPVDPHHMKAVGWREAKRNDYTAVPLCREHHSEVEQFGVGDFCQKYWMDDLWKDVSYNIIAYLKDHPPCEVTK